MPPRARRAPVWHNTELLDLIAVCGEEAVQSQLRSSRRNFDTFGQISRAMIERGHDRDAMQCRIKVKELRSAYHKAREANNRSGSPPKTCRFYKQLDAILGGDPTSVPSTTVDTGEREKWRRRRGEKRRRRRALKKAGARVLWLGETPLTPWVHAARSSSRARRKGASRSGRYAVEEKKKSRFAVSSFYFREVVFSVWGPCARRVWAACMPRCGRAH
ncbi:zinc finger and SCAN domain containing 29 [Chelydra serpentina]|uniref:Zinc finger and SCAN domain containing 29 n=1 Tax=Chelydra serpentina TaxID=8475 RepID=A0A8T1S065_CHESE|nr:zinc finger and SCAN domain containing 29 [Chelydra serpentina]